MNEIARLEILRFRPTPTKQMVWRPDEYDLVGNLAQNREIGRRGLNGNERHVEFSAAESLENMATAAGLQRESAYSVARDCRRPRWYSDNLALAAAMV